MICFSSWHHLLVFEKTKDSFSHSWHFSPSVTLDVCLWICCSSSLVSSFGGNEHLLMSSSSKVAQGVQNWFLSCTLLYLLLPLGFPCSFRIKRQSLSRMLPEQHLCSLETYLREKKPFFLFKHCLPRIHGKDLYQRMFFFKVVLSLSLESSETLDPFHRLSQMLCGFSTWMSLLDKKSLLDAVCVLYALKSLSNVFSISVLLCIPSSLHTQFERNSCSFSLFRLSLDSSAEFWFSSSFCWFLFYNRFSIP